MNKKDGRDPVFFYKSFFVLKYLTPRSNIVEKQNNQYEHRPHPALDNLT